MKHLALSALLMSALSCSSEPTPVEIGKVAWKRDFEAALGESKESGKPVFLLFQEVPGCAGCKQFGQDVLGDERLVTIIERDFVPVLVRNNVGGKEAEIRKRYKEPAWNFQVVRFLDAGGRDLVPRKDKVWTTRELAPRMKQALEKADRPVPADLEDLIAARPGAEAVFAMHCFWTGEARLGALDGVTTTEAGFFDGREVVRVTYDESRISRGDLLAAASRAKCADRVYLHPRERTLTGDRFGIFDPAAYRRAPESDQKRQLRGTAAEDLDLGPEQATKVNAWIRTDPAKARSFMDPAQRAQLADTP